MENVSLLLRNTGVSDVQALGLSISVITASPSGSSHSGGTHSDCVIVNEVGKTVGHSTGEGTNPWVSLHLSMQSGKR